MKKIIILTVVLLFCINSLLAQRNTMVKTEKFDSKMKDMLKEDTEIMFKTSEAPDAYKNESIITLAQKVRLKFYGSSNLASSLMYVHTRILLNDIAALEEFSDFSFDKPSSSSAIQLNIVKTNGKVEPVNLDDAVSDEKTIKTRYSGFSFSEEKKKIALKNLQIGDILEYVGLFDNWQGNYQTTYYFAGQYSIVSSKIVYEVERANFVVAYKSINNAPPFVVSKSKTGMIYTVNDTMRKRYEEEPDDYTAYTEPHFKMHIIPARSQRNYKFSYQIGKAKTEVTEKDLKQEVWDLVSTLYNSSTEYYLDYIEKYGYNQSDEEFIKTYFYYLRDRIYTYSATFSTEFKANSDLMNKLIRAAKKRNIPYEIVLFKDKTEGRFEDILFEDELYWGVVFNTREGDVGFYSFHQYAHPDEIPSDYEGTTSYRFKIGSNITNTTVTKYEVPYTSDEHNIYKTTIVAEFVGGVDSLKMNQTVEQKGLYRNRTKFDLNNRYTSFNNYLKQLKEEKLIQNDDLRYYFLTNGAYVDFDQKFIDSEELRCREVFKEHQDERLKNYFKKEHLSNKYTLLKYIDFNIISDSHEPDHNWVEWDEEFIVGDVAHQLNDKMLVIDIGALFGKMYQINSDKNREVRTKPYVVAFNKTFVNDLSFKLPAGYSIKDLKALNQTFENNQGKFTTVATLEGNTLHLVLTKTYKANTYSKDEWPAFIAFLDASAGFNQISVVLEK